MGDVPHALVEEFEFLVVKKVAVCISVYEGVGDRDILITTLKEFASSGVGTSHLPY